MTVSEIYFTTRLPDKNEFFSLFETTGWNKEYKVDPDELCTVLNNSFYTISAYDETTLIGFGRMLSDGCLHAILFDVIVLPEYQRRGIGAEVMKRLIAKCRELNIRDIQLFCAENMQEFYKTFGFSERPGNAPGMEIKQNYE